MWDIGGQDALRSSWDTYYANTEVSVVSVYIYWYSSSYCHAAWYKLKVYFVFKMKYIKYSFLNGI